LFATRGPDAVGIQDVGREAGISHPMVIHYFGTYEGLVRETLLRLNQRTIEEIQRRLSAPESPAMGEMMSLMLGVLQQPAYARLMSWVALSGQAEKLPIAGTQGLRHIADALERRGERAVQDGFLPTAPPRRAIEMAILLGVAAGHGYAIGKSLFVRGLGLSDSAELEAEFGRALSEVVLHYLVRAGLEAAEESQKK
jgi:AcrR family transcriptional regulator